MATEIRTRKYVHWKIPEKNRIRKIREKSGYKIHEIFDQILVIAHRKGLIYEMKPKYFEIFTELINFKIEFS